MEMFNRSRTGRRSRPSRTSSPRVLFILALRGLSSQETARRGNLYGIVGMAIAIARDAARSRRRRTSTRCCSRAIVVGGRRSARDGRARRHDADARAGRAAAQLRRPRRRARRLLAAARTRRAPADRPSRSRSTSTSSSARSRTTGSVLAFLKLRGSVSRQAAAAAGAPLAEPRDAGRHRRARRARTRDDSRSRGRSLVGDRDRRACSACTWSRRSAARTCRSSSRCSTATRDGPRPPPASCSHNDLLIITGALVGRAARSSRTSCAGR